MRNTVVALSFAMLAAAGCSDGRGPANGAAVINPRITRATDLGRVSSDTEFDFVIGFKLRNTEALHKFLTEKSITGDVMTPSDFADQFGPSAADYFRMVTWLRSHGLVVTRTVEGRTSVTVHGRTDAIERAFGVELHEYSDSDGTFDAANAPLKFPYELTDEVVGNVGLNGTGGWRSHRFVPQALMNPPSASLGAALLEQLYSAPAANTNPGKGETIAILGAGDGPALATDINGTKGYMATSRPYGLTALPATGGGYSVVNVGGPNRDPQRLASGEQGENDLDVDMVLAFAPYAKIVHVLTATNSPGLFTDGISYIVNTLKDAHQVTVSYGTCERGAASEMPVMNAMFMQAQAESQQWFFAAGDSGADGCRDYPSDPNTGQPTAAGANKIVSAGWPASSPYVVSVGGTQINNGDTTESAWDNGGGSPSESFDKPAYQMGVTPNDGARDTPDVAALAGPPYINTVVNARTVQVGGTSAATPMWAAIWALVDQSKGANGFTDGLTHIYGLGGTAAFYDVTTGQINGPDGPLGSLPGYSAGSKYDLATGWGSPVIPSLISGWK